MKFLFLKLIKFYQKAISPLLGRHCRFYPNCSSYCYSTIEKHGVWKGSWRGLKRILKCNPWNPGGVDKP